MENTSPLRNADSCITLLSQKALESKTNLIDFPTGLADSKQVDVYSRPEAAVRRLEQAALGMANELLLDAGSVT